MKLPRVDDEQALLKILERQKKLCFDFDKSLPWKDGIDLKRYFVPLDEDALIFPEAGPEERLVLSQYLGLVIARTFGEMETALVQAKDKVWKRNLDRYPVSPEFEALGEQFFAEEEKHSRMFKRYLELFSAQTGLSFDELASLLPSVSGTMLEKALQLNSDLGGHALWWVLTFVEEISILIFKQLRPFQTKLDPLYFAMHRRHFEEEVRHSSYSYWMLEHLYRRDRSAKQVLFRKTDLLLAQALEVSWTFQSLSRIRNAKRLKDKHPFYGTLARLMPLLRRRSPFEIIRRMFISAPFVSLMLNPNHFEDYKKIAGKLRAYEIPVPKPKLSRLTVS